MLCTQPQCALQGGSTHREALIDLVLGVLSGKSTDDLVPQEQRIEAREACGACVARVVDGYRPFFTEEEQERLVEVGRWSWRRHRWSRRRSHA